MRRAIVFALFFTILSTGLWAQGNSSSTGGLTEARANKLYSRLDGTNWGTNPFRLPNFTVDPVIMSGEGLLYWNSATKKVMLYNGTVWAELAPDLSNFVTYTGSTADLELEANGIYQTITDKGVVYETSLLPRNGFTFRNITAGTLASIGDSGVVVSGSDGSQTNITSNAVATPELRITGTTYQNRIFTSVSQASDVTYIWPPAQGAAGESFSNDGAGNLSWVKFVPYTNWTENLNQGAYTIDGTSVIIGFPVTTNNSHLQSTGLEFYGENTNVVTDIQMNAGGISNTINYTDINSNDMTLALNPINGLELSMNNPSTTEAWFSGLDPINWLQLQHSSTNKGTVTDTQSYFRPTAFGYSISVGGMVTESIRAENGTVTASNGFVGDLTGTASGNLTTESDPSIPSKTGNALKFLRVNAGETALEFATASGGGGEPYDITIGTPATLPASGKVQYFACYQFVNAIPAMTSNTTPSGVCSAESVLGGDTNNYYWYFRQSDNGNISDNTAVPHWVQYQFPTAKVAIGWSMIPWSIDAFPDRTPYDFKFQGSNDGATWTDLDSRTAFTAWTLNTRKYFWLSGQTTSYTYYRLYVTAQRTGNILGVKQMEIYTAGTDYDMYMRDSSNNVKKLTLTAQ